MLEGLLIFRLKQYLVYHTPYGMDCFRCNIISIASFLDNERCIHQMGEPKHRVHKCKCSGVFRKDSKRHINFPNDELCMLKTEDPIVITALLPKLVRH